MTGFLSTKNFNQWAAGETGRAFNELRLDGRVVGFLSNIDITAAATGNYVYGRPGISTPAALQIWANLIAQAKGIPLSSTTAPATSQSAR